MSRKKETTNPPATNRGVETVSSTRILSFGVDWLTATTRSKAVSDAWYAWYDTVHTRRDGEPASYEYCRRQGHDGKLLPDNTFVGRREYDNNTLWISTSSAAMRDWRVIAGAAHNITRLDLQVTCEFRRPQRRDVALDIYRNRDLSALDHRHWQSDKGSTCYVGSAKSAWFGRVYDKSWDLDRPQGSCWRYEVVSKSKPTNAVIATSMEEAAQAGVLHEYVAGWVYNWFADRTARPVFCSTSPIAPVLEVGTREIYPDRQIAWLRTQVQPTLARLVLDGYALEAYDALGVTAGPYTLVSEDGEVIGRQSDSPVHEPG